MTVPVRFACPRYERPDLRGPCMCAVMPVFLVSLDLMGGFTGTAGWERAEAAAVEVSPSYFNSYSLKPQLNFEVCLLCAFFRNLGRWVFTPLYAPTLHRLGRSGTSV